MNKFIQKLKKINRQTNYMLGYLLMLIGIFIFVMSIPPWLWMILLGILLVITGYYVNIYFK
jgi:hypothetical protein